MKMSKENASVIKNFIDDFIENASDDDALYLIESLKSICKFASEHPKKVEKFIERKKREYNKT